MRMLVRPIADSDLRVVEPFLRAGLPADAYLLDALESGGVSGFLGAFAGEELRGVASWRRGALSAAQQTDRDAARQLAVALGARGPWGTVVGPDGPCSEIVRVLVTRDKCRVDRVQLFMVADRETELGPGEPRLRVARPEDLDRLVPLVAAYRLEDGLSRPGEDHRSWIRAHTSDRIADQHVHLVEAGGEVVFTAAFNFLGSHGGGIGGVYTVPSARGRGIASRATAELCRIALERGPYASLHVARDNQPAIHAYRRAGLREAGLFRLTFR